MNTDYSKEMNSLAGVLILLFVALKLDGVIDWTWFQVLFVPQGIFIFDGTLHLLGRLFKRGK